MINWTLVIFTLGPMALGCAAMIKGACFAPLDVDPARSPWFWASLILYVIGFVVFAYAGATGWRP